MKIEEDQEKSDFHTKSLTSIASGGPIDLDSCKQRYSTVGRIEILERVLVHGVGTRTTLLP